jgi:hypothetical protein
MQRTTSFDQESRVIDWSNQHWSTAFASIVFLAFMARLAVAFLFADMNPQSANLWEYGAIAKLAMANDGHLMFSNTLPDGTKHVYPTAYMPPLHIFIWMGLFSLFGISKTALGVMIGLNVIFATLICGLTGLAARKLFKSPLVSLGAATFVALNPVFAYSVATYHGLNVYIALLLAIFLLVAEGKRDGWQRYAWAGLLTGLATLARTEYLILGMALHMASFFAHRNYRYFGITVLATFAVILPWTARNYQVFDKFILVANTEGYNLHKGFNPEANGSGDWVDNHGVRARQLGEKVSAVQGGLDYESRLDLVYKTAALEFIKAHPYESFVVLPAKKLVLFWTFDYHDDLTHRIAYQLQFWPLFILSLLGVWKAVRDGLFNENAHRAVLALFLVQSFVMMGYAVHARYRMNVEPFLYCYAAFAFQWLVGGRFTRQYPN